MASSPDLSETSNPPDNDVPENWLNEEFFEGIIGKDFGNYTLIGFSSETALPSGENYTSVLNRIKVDIETEDGTKFQPRYILKSPLVTNLSKEIFNGFEMFSRELEMYDSIIPKLEKIYENIGKSEKFFPKCLKADRVLNAIVLEDLCAKNFKMITRQVGMDLKHAKAVLRKLAKFHASSACLPDKIAEISQLFDQDYFTKSTLPMMESMMEPMWPFILQSLDKIKGCKDYAKKLKDQTSRAGRLLAESVSFDPNEFNVLNHGDLWSNNIMFQYDTDNNIMEVYFIDVQMSRWGSSTQDLYFFLILSLNSEIRTKFFDYLVKYYHDQLIQNLQLLEFQGRLPKLADLHIAMLKRGYLGLNTALIALPTIIIEPTEHACIENLFLQSESSNKFRKLMFFSSIFEKTMQELLPFFDNRGFLDF